MNDSRDIASGGRGSLAARQDEIRLSDLVAIFSARALLMGVIVALSVAAAVLFLWWAKPVYRVELFLLPPLVEEVTLRDGRGVAISSMELARLPFDNYTPEEVYGEFQVNLDSRNLRRDFFDDTDIYERYRRLFSASDWSRQRVFEDRFNADLQLHRPRKGEDLRFVRLSFELPDPTQAAEILNGFVTAVERHTVQQLFNPVLLRLRGQIQALKDEIVRVRQSALTMIGDDISQADEAAKVAKSLGLIEALELSNGESQTVGDSVLTTGRLAYRRGERALRAEIAALQARKGKDAFVPGLRELEDQLARLTNVEFDLQPMRSARLDQIAMVPEQPVFPRPALVIALALLVGVLLALGAALAQHAWQRTPQAH